MKVFRIIIVVLLGACVVPVLVLAVAAAIGALGGCPLQFETPHVCAIGGKDVGWLVDALLPYGVWGGLTAGLAAYVFAAWVMVELAAIVVRALRRS